MDGLSLAELDDLASTTGLGLPDAQASAVLDQVNSFLDPLDGIDDLTLPAPDDGGERTWHRPSGNDDPYNAIACRCDVPPTADASTLLGDVTVGLKDNVAVAGVPMEAATEVLRGYVPNRDATVVRRLREAGATITAKTNLDEFAGSARGTTGANGPISNPHDPEHTAGGSSGGSAVAVASGAVDVAIGSDTGGSIRMPAAFCGVVGLKPTYGLVPLTGVVENTYTQDHLGPMTTTVADAARTLDAVAGKDPDGPGSMQAAARDDYRVGGYADAVDAGVTPEQLTVGVLDDGFGDGVAPAVEARTHAAVDALADAGATVTHASVDGFDRAPVVKNVLSLCELAAHWRDAGAPLRRGGVVDDGYVAALDARTRTRGRLVGSYYRSKLLAGAHLLAEDGGRRYARAQAARDVLAKACADALADVDALVFPTVPDVAPRLDDAADPGFGYGRNTRLADVTRLPALTLPNGSVDGLPVGLQLMAPAFEEAHLLAVGACVESVLSDLVE